MPTGPIAFDGAVKVRAFDAKDEPRVLEVLQAAFGQWPRDIQGVTASEFFRWSIWLAHSVRRSCWLQR
jgi:hypothetical protein